MTDDVDEDLGVVARMVAARLLGAVGDEWEEYPDVGEYDWADICGRVVGMVTPPERGAYLSAYERLAARATAE